MKSEHAISKSSEIKSRHEQNLQSPSNVEFSKITSNKDAFPHIGSIHEGSIDGKSTHSSNVAFLEEPCKESSDDDWEAIADRAPDELLSVECLSGVSKLSLDDSKFQILKRRGRGTFSYNNDLLYSDRLIDQPIVDSRNENVSDNSEINVQTGRSKYGTCHVLVLSDFPSSTRTIDLERLFENFTGRGVSIRWVNDVLAFAVFPTPSIALEAYNVVHCPFKVRILTEDDEFMSSIAIKDLEPPRPRPHTSARTAQRLIAHGMRLKLPSTNFGLDDLRKQEKARKCRIVNRQIERDDAWGADDLS